MSAKTISFSLTSTSDPTSSTGKHTSEPSPITGATSCSTPLTTRSTRSSVTGICTTKHRSHRSRSTAGCESSTTRSTAAGRGRRPRRRTSEQQEWPGPWPNASSVTGSGALPTVVREQRPRPAFISGALMWPVTVVESDPLSLTASRAPRRSRAIQARPLRPVPVGRRRSTHAPALRSRSEPDSRAALE